MQEDYTIEEYTDDKSPADPPRGSFKAKLAGFLSGPYFVVLVVILVALIAFSLGRISGLEDKREPVRVINSGGEVRGVSTSSATADSSGQVVASKSGTKYHYPWCAGAKQISEKNKIIFNSIEEARAAGYTPASNCKGLK